MGDFNETKKRSKLFQSLYNLGMVDMVFARHGDIPPFRSCNKGDNIIDFAFCSSSLLSCIQTSAYEPFKMNTMSDHRGIVIDFNTQQLLGQQEHIVSPNKRGLNANNPIQVERFLDELQHYWKKYNIATRISQATKQPPNVTSLRSTVNSIDRDITKAMLRAEKKVRKSERPPWSPALKQASLQVKYYKLLRQQRLQKMDLSTAIQHTRQQLETTPEHPQTSQEYQTLLRKAQKALKKIRQNNVIEISIWTSY